MLAQVSIRMLSPWSIALLLSLIEVPLNSWSLKFSISFRVLSFLFSTSPNSLTVFSSSLRSTAIFSRYSRPSGERGSGCGQRRGWVPSQKSSVKLSA